jgi:Glyoxalase-like domain
MALRVGNVTFDCDDALVVGHFWSQALGRPLDPGSSSAYCSIGSGDAERTELAWLFERVPESKSSKNRMHVDLVDPDPGVVERLVTMGATFVAEHEIQGGGHRWTVMQDPEGNEFCVAVKSFVA